MFNSLELHQSIENIVKESGTDYIDAILHYCSVNDLEVETVGAMISKDLNLISKIQVEAEDLHYIKRISTLPI
jgi:hypothetical protein